MPWFKIDDNLYGHRKTLKAGVAAMGLWTVAGSYCARYLTDGIVDFDVVTSIAGNKGKLLAAKLVEAGLWFIHERGWAFRDWDVYQPSKAEILSHRSDVHRLRSEAGKRSGEARRSRCDRSETNGSRSKSDSMISETEILQFESQHDSQPDDFKKHRERPSRFEQNGNKTETDGNKTGTKREPHPHPDPSPNTQTQTVTKSQPNNSSNPPRASGSGERARGGDSNSEFGTGESGTAERTSVGPESGNIVSSNPESGNLVATPIPAGEVSTDSFLRLTAQGGFGQSKNEPAPTANFQGVLATTPSPETQNAFIGHLSQATRGKKREVGIRRSEQAFMVSAYERGISKSINRAYTMPPDQVRTLDELIDGHCPDRNTAKRQEWVERNAEKFASIVDGNDYAKTYRGGLDPKGLLRWLNDGCPETIVSPKDPRHIVQGSWGQSEEFYKLEKY